MEDLEAEVNKILATKSSTKYDLYYGVSPDGILFAILTTKGLWYKVRVFGKLCPEIFYLQFQFVNFLHHVYPPQRLFWSGLFDKRREVIINSSEHATEEGAKKQIEKYKAELENGFYNCLFPEDFTDCEYGFPEDIIFAGRILPDETIITPDKYLKAGDVIKTSSNNYGIYLGNGEVAYTLLKNKKEAIMPQITKLYPDFVKDDEVLVKLIFSYNFRKPENIVNIAKGFVNSELQDVKYKMLFPHSEFFVACCVLGLKLPVEGVHIIYIESGVSPDDIPFLILSTESAGTIFGLLFNKKPNSQRKVGIPDVFHYLNPLNWSQTILEKASKRVMKCEDMKSTTRMTTHKGKMDMIKWIRQSKAEIQGGLYNCMFPDQSYQEFRENFFFTSETLPTDAITNPANYLEPGDVLSTHFVGGSSHYGIYIGDGKVVHVSGHGGGKSASVARFGELCPDFVEPTGTIKKLVFSYSLRKPEKIVEIAKGFANARFRDGAYHLLFQNCQHFVTRCALGLEISPDRAALGYVVNSIYRNKDFAFY